MQFEEYFIMLTPAIVSLVGVVAALIKGFKKIRDTVDSIKEDVNIKDLKNEVKTLLDQNYELRDEVKELTEAITKIRK
ncbi:MAG: hypothetical protein J6S85_21980 [Methanobrevibacter sp.]|nr:hypothetical protein [Methanobrevibacter sp.]